MTGRRFPPKWESNSVKYCAVENTKSVTFSTIQIPSRPWTKKMAMTALQTPKQHFMLLMMMIPNQTRARMKTRKKTVRGKLQKGVKTYVKLTIRTRRTKQRMGPQSQWQVKATRKVRKRPRHQLKCYQRPYIATAAGPKCKQCHYEEKREKDPSLPVRKKSHYEFCPKSKVYKDRVKELRGLLQEEPSLEAGSEEYLASAALIKHLQVKLGHPYDSSQERVVLNRIVGDGPVLKKQKAARKTVVKAPPTHNVYKSLDPQAAFGPSSGTAESSKVFFMPTTRGGGAGAAKKVQALYEKEYNEKNKERKRQQEVAKAAQEAQQQLARARREMAEQELAAKMHAQRQQVGQASPRSNGVDDAVPPFPITVTAGEGTGVSSASKRQATKSLGGSGVLKAEELQRLLLLELAKPTKEQARPTAKNSKAARAPRPVLALFTIVRSYLPQRWHGASNNLTGGVLNKTAMEWFENNFRGELFFRVPRLPPSIKPSPAYHSLMGVNLYMLQWELLQPGLKIKCPRPNCPGFLIHDRLEFGKNQRLVPLFGLQGKIDWVSEMKYKCTESKHGGCKCKCISASAPMLTKLLPPGIVSAYPVDPRYVKPTIHLTKNLTNWLRSSTITYLSAEMFAKLLNEELNNGYVDEVKNYVNLWLESEEGEDNNDAMPPYPNEFERTGAFPPSGALLRDLMHEAERSTLTETGVSDFDRHRRELISVTCNLAFAFDHCFATGKSYKDPLIMNTFNVTNETGQMMGSFCCNSTAIGESAHAVEQMARRPSFHPSIYYSDIYPKGKEFWNMIVGSSVLGRLGLFHYCQRVVRTLRDKHPQSTPAIKDLKLSIYEYDEDDLSNVVEALMEGKMGGSKSKKYTSKEIDEMMYTRVWKDRYDKYLKKKIHNPAIIGHKLRLWLKK